jgi:hypothetical protein
MKKNKLSKTLIIGIVVLFVGAVLVPNISSVSNQSNLKDTSNGRASFNPFLEGWKHRKMVPVNHEMVAGHLTDFPVLVSYTDADLLEKAQIDGDDILFMDDKGEANQLFHEIEYYDGFTGELVAWVNVPYLSPNEDTVFYMYYGNPNSPAQEQPWGVWDSDYIHVWHMGDSLSDSAGTNYGNNYGTSVVSGKVGKARDFERNENDYIDCGDMTQPADGSLTTMTWEAWVKPETANIVLMSKYNTKGPSYGSYFIAFTHSDNFRNTAYSGSGVYTNSETNNPYSVVGEWVYLTSTFTLGGTNDIVPFINGIEVSDTQSQSNGNVMRDVPVTDDIGRVRTEIATHYTDAVIDEVRWSKTVRSDDWILTSFNNMNDPQGFSNFCSEEINYRVCANRPLLNFLQNHPNLFPLLQRLIFLRFGL